MGYRYIEARKLASEVVEGCTSCCNSIEVLVRFALVCVVGSLGLGARVLDWPGGQWLNKVGWIGIINHGHSAE